MKIMNTIVLALFLGSAVSEAKAPAKTAAPAKATSEKKAESSTAPLIKVIKMDGADGKDIVEIASASKDHSSLVAAIIAAGLVETLKGAGPYTIFAPSNAAFAKLPKATVDELFKAEKQADLKALLEHHAAAPRYNVDVLAGLTEMDMVDGPKLKITVKDRKISADGVELSTAIIAKNGIIYLVDTVLVPKAQ